MKFTSSQQIKKTLAKTLAATLLVATACNLPALSQFAPATKTNAQARAQQNAQRILGWRSFALGLSNRIVDQQEKQQFEADVTAFQQRAAKDKLDLMEIVNTYVYVDKLFNVNEPSIDDYATRVSIAEDVMHQAADPTDIDQGQTGTCAPNALQKRIYSRAPSAMGKLQYDLSRTGSYTAVDGQTVKLDPYSKQADRDSKFYHIQRSSSDASRSRASQRDSWVLASLYLKEIGSPNEYRQRYEGSRIFDPRTRAERPVDIGKDFGSPVKMADRMYYLITGHPEHGFSIVAGRFEIPSGACGVNSPDELKAVLVEMKGDDKHASRFPAVVQVHTGNPPFRSENPLRGWHEITIVDFDAKSGLVWVDNQWGRAFDHLGRWDGKQPIHYTVLFGAINDSAHADAPPIPEPTPLKHAVVKHDLVRPKGK
jgi:hypothetical protein